MCGEVACLYTPGRKESAISKDDHPPMYLKILQLWHSEYLTISNDDRLETEFNDALIWWRGAKFINPNFTNKQVNIFKTMKYIHQLMNDYGFKGKTFWCWNRNISGKLHQYHILLIPWARFQKRSDHCEKVIGSLISRPLTISRSDRIPRTILLWSDHDPGRSCSRLGSVLDQKFHHNNWSFYQ